ncbi:hypothetical protein [Sodalis glossinidius]|uniref:hypothetical protein n=1 Tax=Sodalis glossinidius TaxID=63612 RepID=UPI0011D13D5A|nr:hypothetical protein [Sodalis glossinidius]
MPSAQKDNEYWFDASEHQGTFEDPKDEYEYGKIGSIYHCFGRYYLARNTSSPEAGRWRCPQQGESDDVIFLSIHAGTYGDPKKERHSGNRGDIYFSADKESYFILKADVSSAAALKPFPSEEKDDECWYASGNA